MTTIQAPRAGAALERTYNVIVFVDSTSDLVIRPVQATSPLAARRQYLQVMGRNESIVRVETP
jgi:hypothetical protein